MAAWTQRLPGTRSRSAAIWATLLSAFPALVPERRGAHTVLTSLLDRSALYGVLAECEALGLDLVEVRQLGPEHRSPGPGDGCSR